MWLEIVPATMTTDEREEHVIIVQIIDFNDILRYSTRYSSFCGNICKRYSINCAKDLYCMLSLAIWEGPKNLEDIVDKARKMCLPLRHGDLIVPFEEWDGKV